MENVFVFFFFDFLFINSESKMEYFRGFMGVTGELGSTSTYFCQPGFARDCFNMRRIAQSV